MLKLKLQFFVHLMQRADSLETTLMLGKTGQEEKGMTEVEMAMSLRKLQEIVKVRKAWSATVHGVAKSGTEQQQHMCIVLK